MKQYRFYTLIIGLSVLGTILLLELSSNDYVVQNIGKQWLEYLGVACTIISMLLAIGAYAKLQNENSILNEAKREAERRNVHFNSIENASNLIKEISSIEDYLEANNYDSAKSILPSIKRHFHEIASTIHASKSVLELLQNTATYSYKIEFDDYNIDDSVSIVTDDLENSSYNVELKDIDQKENSKNSPKNLNPNFLAYYSALIPRMEQFLSDLDTLLMNKINRQNIIDANRGEIQSENNKDDNHNRYFTPLELKIITKNFQGICSFAIDFKTILKNNLS